MKIDKKDPRLTAYILGELEPSDILLIEKALTEDAELKKEVNLLKQGLGQLKTHFSEQESFRLNPEQREKILNLGVTATQKKSSFSWLTIGGGLVAASFAIMVFRTLPNQKLYDEPLPTVALEKSKKAEGSVVTAGSDTLGASLGATSSNGLAAKADLTSVDERDSNTAESSAGYASGSAPTGAANQDSATLAPATEVIAATVKPEDLSENEVEPLAANRAEETPATAASPVAAAAPSAQSEEKAPPTEVSRETAPITQMAKAMPAKTLEAKKSASLYGKLASNGMTDRLGMAGLGAGGSGNKLKGAESGSALARTGLLSSDKLARKQPESSVAKDSVAAAVAVNTRKAKKEQTDDNTPSFIFAFSISRDPPKEDNSISQELKSKTSDLLQACLQTHFVYDVTTHYIFKVMWQIHPELGTQKVRAEEVTFSRQLTPALKKCLESAVVSQNWTKPKTKEAPLNMEIMLKIGPKQDR